MIVPTLTARPRASRSFVATVLGCNLLLLGCAGPEPAADLDRRLDYALAIHGGAGTIPEAIADEQKERYTSAMSAALKAGVEMLAQGRSSLDVVEEVIRRLEDDPLFNAGKGAVFNHDGGHELDAAIMDGRTLGCGAVAGVRTVKNPIRLARLVMERTSHVLLAGPGADRFALEMKLDTVDQGYFFTKRRHEAWRRAIEAERQQSGEHGTVGAVALDRAGDLAAGTSTGGLTNKKFGRVGDVPLIGAGTYASNGGCAVSCTGKGEEFIRNAIAHRVSMLVEREGLGVGEAAREVLASRIAKGDGGLIAVGRDGQIAMEFNTAAMPRAAADSTGRFEVSIW